MNVYNYFEPTIGQVFVNNVTIIKENNRLSEQTFGLLLTVGDPGEGISAATLQPDNGQIDGFDYVVNLPGDNTALRIFQPNMNSAIFSFFIFADSLIENTEGLRVTLTSQGAPFPNFALTSDADPAPYPSTLIRIFDAGGKYVYANN